MFLFVFVQVWARMTLRNQDVSYLTLIVLEGDTWYSYLVSTLGTLSTLSQFFVRLVISTLHSP